MIRTFIKIAILLPLLIESLNIVNATDRQSPDNPFTASQADAATSGQTPVESCNRFSFKLFKDIAAREERDSNIFISPFSVSYSLGMIYNGAAGETRKSIAEALEIDGLSDLDINLSYQVLTGELMRADPLVDYRVASSVWYRSGKALKTDFMDICKTYYDAYMKDIDFGAPWAADTINNWVNRATGERINEMVRHPLKPEYAMILLNATYFKGGWTFPFDTAKTRPLPFHLADGSQIECEMMFLGEDDHVIMTDEGRFVYDSSATYYGNEIFQAVNLPYGDKGFRMAVIVPDSTLVVDSILSAFTFENWSTWLGHFRAMKFNVLLPKFKFRYEIDLKESFEKMGMESLLDPDRCDMSNAFADGIGWLDEVSQKTFIQVDERGTEAVDATQYIIADSITPCVVANRPFLVVIHEAESGLILHIGKIANPVWIE